MLADKPSFDILPKSAINGRRPVPLVTIAVELHNVEGTQAAMGWAGNHTIVVDRPEGKAGGKGLGFNGGQLLALALGGCFCNDLRYVSNEMNVQLDKISVNVVIELDGDPLITKAATMKVSFATRDGSDPRPIMRRAMDSCMVSNSISRGVPVAIEMAD